MQPSAQSGALCVHAPLPSIEESISRTGGEKDRAYCCAVVDMQPSAQSGALCEHALLPSIQESISSMGGSEAAHTAARRWTCSAAKLTHGDVAARRNLLTKPYSLGSIPRL